MQATKMYVVKSTKSYVDKPVERDFIQTGQLS